MGVKARQQADGTWFCYINFNGTRRAIKAPQNQRDAEKMARALDARLRLGDAGLLAPEAKPPAPAPARAFPTLRAALGEWLDAKEQRGEISASTPYHYRAACERWLLAHVLPDGRILGDVPVNMVTREALGGVVQAIKAAGKSTTTLDHVHNPLRGFYRSLVESKILPTSPASDLGYFIGKRKRGKRVEFFTPEEARRLLDAARAQSPALERFIKVGLLAGLRWGEIAGLHKSAIDFDRKRIHVQASWCQKSYRLETTKSKNTRDVDATPALLDALRAQCNATTGDLIFPGPSGGYISKSTFGREWAATLKAAGLRSRAFHCCRHSFASMHLASGAEPLWLSQQLGHSSLTITLGTYAHLLPDRHAGQAAKLDALLIA